MFRVVVFVAFVFLAACQTNSTVPTGQITSENIRSDVFVIKANDLNGLKKQTKSTNLILKAGFPDGEGPFPVVIILHGSGNMKGRDTVIGEQLVSRGVAWLGVYTYDSRGLRNKSYKYRLAKANIFDQVSDAYAALDFAESHPLLDSTNAALTGFSLGGLSTVMAATDWASSLSKNEFVYLLNQYSPCILFSENIKQGIRLDHMWGSEDAQSPEAECRAMARHFSEKGTVSNVDFYSKAAHGWFSSSESVSPFSFMGCRASIDGERIQIIQANENGDGKAIGSQINNPSDIEAIKLLYKNCYAETPYISRPNEEAEKAAIEKLVDALN